MMRASLGAGVGLVNGATILVVGGSVVGNVNGTVILVRGLVTGASVDLVINKFTSTGREVGLLVGLTVRLVGRVLGGGVGLVIITFKSMLGDGSSGSSVGTDIVKSTLAFSVVGSSVVVMSIV